MSNKHMLYHHVHGLVVPSFSSYETSVIKQIENRLGIKLKTRDKLIYLAFAANCNKLTQILDYPQKIIADALGISVSTLKRAIKTLKELGLLICRKNVGAPDSIYVVNPNKFTALLYL